MKLPKIIDNKKNGRVVNEIRDNVCKESKLSIISAYFTIYAYNELKKELSKIDRFRFIFTEPSFVNSDNEVQREYYIQHNENNLAGNEFEIKLRNEMRQSAIAKECAEWLSKKAEIKSLKKENPAQPRLIHIDNGSDSVCINGSVDFTTDGLGITPSSRIDSNTCIYGNEFTSVYLQMFDELWNNSAAVEDVKEKVLQHMQILYKENTPEFIYFITLYNVFKEYLGELTEDNIVKTRTGIKDTLIWNKLYKFQRDGVIGAIDKIEKYNGCIIADSVGLGKTYTALAIIKYYELRNDRVLVLAPKKLRDNWSVYTQNDKRNIFVADRFNYTVLNHTDLSRTSGYTGDIPLATVNWGNYDLVVIDESHNFRNNPPVKGRVTRYERLMNDIIKSGVKTKVLMLSATPVNNRMNDIKNQIAFITEGKDNALSGVGITSIEQVLKKAQTVFNRWSELPDAKRTTESFVEMMNVDYFKLLDTLTIARSRKHIEKYYDSSEIGKFPDRRKPQNIYPDIDTLGEFPTIEKVNKQIKHLSLGLYSPFSYVLPEKRPEYERKYDMSVGSGKSVFKQADREASLIGLIRVGLLKRMESSIFSFALTIEKILRRIKDTIAIIDSNQYDIGDNMSIEDIDLEDSDLDTILFGSKVKVLLQDMDLVKWRQDLSDDADKLQTLLNDAKKITIERDAKLLELKRIINHKIDNPINPGNKKVIVFTAFADTANYLYDCLSEELKNRGIYSAIVTGTGNNRSTLPIDREYKNSIRMSDLNTVLTLFSPKSKECAKIYPNIHDEIDVLIATDCISEGQNLQDCDYLINYDIHWNPVRIIQRFGRIDRIGSTNKEIQLVNFWAMKELDEYINLAQRVKGRMVLLNVSATGEEDYIEESESKEMKDLEYRKKQLEQLQNEVVDLEEISGGISITDVTFNDFKTDLMEYMKSHRKQLNDAPSGLYAVTDIDDSLRDTVKPGVIFTLRQLQGKEQTKEQNPLFPFYLVYITEDGEVKLSYLQAKRILDYYKKLCCGKNEVLKELVAEFNKETDEGHNMKKYSDLLETAIQELIGRKQEVGVASLFSRGGTTMQTSFFDGVEDFELITFLVLR